MGHPAIDNRSPFAFEAIHLADEDARPLLVTIVRATYEISGRGLQIAEEQAPVPVAGVLHGDSPETSSYRFEPETAFLKLATDVVLLGHAYAPRVGAVEGSVGIQVGPLSKTARIFGDRVWVKGAGSPIMTRPQPFEKIPLVYERCFGGWDLTAGTPERPVFDPRNPVGTGFRSASHGAFQEGIRLPNIEDPADKIDRYGELVPVAGFGFTSANWQPRLSLAGTYDEAWMKDRMPLLPRDFDRRFFSAASPGLVAHGYLRGDEPVSVLGASPVGQLSFRLPGAPRPTCLVTLVHRKDTLVETQLDTVVVDTDEDKVYLTWRGHVPLRDGPHDVRSILVDTPGLTRPAPRGSSPSTAASAATTPRAPT